MTTLRRPSPGAATGGGVAHPAAKPITMNGTSPAKILGVFGMRPPDVREAERISRLWAVDDLNAVVDRRRDVGDRDDVRLAGRRGPAHRVEADRVLRAVASAQLRDRHRLRDAVDG